MIGAKTLATLTLLVALLAAAIGFGVLAPERLVGPGVIDVATLSAGLVETIERADISAIILPLLAAALTVCASKGMQAIGSIWSVAANLSGLISDRLGTPI